MEFKKGTSWKNKLQIAIDKAIEKSKTFDDFIKTMEEFGYEIKFGKYLSFRHKDKRDNGRFTRAKNLFNLSFFVVYIAKRRKYNEKTV